MTELSTRVSRQEEVASSPLSRVIADVLAHTSLVDADGSAEPGDHWKDPAVLDATRKIVARLVAEGYVVSPAV